MSKKSSEQDGATTHSDIGFPKGNPMDGRVIYDYQIQTLEGKMLTFIESLGLRESQEKSAKDIFRDIFYRSMYFELETVHDKYFNDPIEKARGEKNPSGVASSN